MTRYQSDLEQLRSAGAIKHYRQVSSPQGAWIKVDGSKVLNLCSNNYLGLANHPKVTKAAIKAIEKYGVGTGAVRALSGNSILHEKLETELASFKGCQSAFVVQSGFIANIVAVQTLLDKEDIVISDELNHASIIDAVRIAQVENKFIYTHNDMKSLEEKLLQASKLKETPRADGREKLILIITDGVFSMDGDIAPLPEIVTLAKKYHALTMVDDAHGEGVLGKGKGIVEHFRLHGQVDIEVGTLSKALGVIGGCIAGNHDLITYYKQKARPFLFSTGLSIPDTAALRESVNILSKSNKLVSKLWKNGQYLNNSLKSLGLDTGNTQTPITPLMLGDEQLARDFSAELFKNKVFATPIVFPMVPKGKARIRLMPSASHSTEDLDFALKAIKKTAQKLKVIK